jgi:hypothetical protein
MMITLTFKARTFLKCQEWYMEIYNILPTNCKRTFPNWCQVYIPILELSVNLPLTNINHINEITMQDVKETVLTVLEDDLLNKSSSSSSSSSSYSEKVEKLLSLTDDLGLCWSTKDRAEWIYWINNEKQDKRIDWFICPQSIEQTHRLELRQIEHTPNHIILQQDFILKEPPPIEGFLLYKSDFYGQLNTSIFKKNLNYFATFDQYLFYIPSVKVSQPNIECFLDETRSPYLSTLSPFKQRQENNKEIEIGEMQRRIKLMTEAKGVIDLTEVSYVRRTFENDLISEQNNFSQISSIGSHTPMLQQEPQPRKSSSSFFSLTRQQCNRNKPCLELVMENGLQIKFEVRNI